MKYNDVSGKLADYRRQIAAIREQMRDTLAGVEPQRVDDYEFNDTEGKVRLSELFGEHEDLIVVHNMRLRVTASWPLCNQRRWI